MLCKEFILETYSRYFSITYNLKAPICFSCIEKYAL